MSISDHNEKLINSIQSQAESFLLSGQVSKCLLLWRGAAKLASEFDLNQSSEISQWADYFESALQLEDDCMTNCVNQHSLS